MTEEINEVKSNYEKEIKAFLAKGGKIQKGNKPDQKKIDNCDIFIACYYNSRKSLAYIQGWVTKETLMNREKERIPLNKGGFGPWNYMVKKEEFKNIQDLALTHTK